MVAFFVSEESSVFVDDIEDVKIVSIIGVNPITLSIVIAGIVAADDRTEDNILLDSSILSADRGCLAADSNTNDVESTTINTISGVVAASETASRLLRIFVWITVNWICCS